MKRIRKSFIASMCLLTAFVLWTVAIRFVDVRAIGPQGSSVGFAGINDFVHALTGVHFSLYIGRYLHFCILDPQRHLATCHNSWDLHIIFDTLLLCIKTGSKCRCLQV